LEGLQGAVLRVKLRHLDRWNEARREHAEAYRGWLKETGLRLLEEMPWGRPVYHLFPVFTAQRDALQQHLQEAGVSTGIHYPIPAHLQQALGDLGYGSGDFPHTEEASRETLSLPMYPELDQDALARVAEAIKRFETKLVQAHA
jgi:dTDP-4-amino-4,6-dideoxygalactose transaminase